MSDLTDKQRAALTALRNVMAEHDINIEIETDDDGRPGLIIGIGHIWHMFALDGPVGFDPDWLSTALLDKLLGQKTTPEIPEFAGTIEQLNKLNIGK